MKKIALICTHNGKKYLGAQVESILQQTLKLNEIIIHDYASTDGTREIINSIVKSNQIVSFKFFDFAESVCHSFFNSLSIIREKYAEEDYILYLCDQDDVWIPTKNELVLSKFQKGAQFVFHDVFIAKSNLQITKASFYSKFWRVDRDFSLPSLYLSNCVIGHTIAISSNFLKDLNLDFDERIPMHDWFLSLCVLKNSIPYCFIPFQLSFYRQHGQNILGASQTNPISKVLKSYRHGKVLYRYQEFLLSRGFQTTISLRQLFLHSFKLRPINKLGFIVLTLIFSFYYKIFSRK